MSMGFECNYMMLALVMNFQTYLLETQLCKFTFRFPLSICFLISTQAVGVTNLLKVTLTNIQYLLVHYNDSRRLVLMAEKRRSKRRIQANYKAFIYHVYIIFNLSFASCGVFCNPKYLFVWSSCVLPAPCSSSDDCNNFSATFRYVLLTNNLVS